jgi:hypothetical protein
MPVTFWAMNAANEFVGNAAVGVHGFGSCHWLLGSGVSGPSGNGSKRRGYGVIVGADYAGMGRRQLYSPAPRRTRRRRCA